LAVFCAIPAAAAAAAAILAMQFRKDPLLAEFFELLGPRLTNNIEITRQAKLLATRRQ
jgi:hypothetical protein